MIPFLLSSLVFLLLPALSSGIPTIDVRSSSVGTPLPGTTAFQLPKPAWIENLVVRPNNDILLTVLSKPDLYLYSPSTKKSNLVHSFPNVLGLLGITETSPDTYVLIAGNFSTAEEKSFPGTYSIWTVSFVVPGGSPPLIRKITDMPEAAFLNGIEVLPHHSETVLIGDPGLGLVWRLNTITGRYEKAIEGVSEMEPSKSAPIASGINGLKIHRGYLYFTNTFTGLYRLAIDSRGAKRRNTVVETIAVGPSWDDMAIDQRGVWVATDVGNTVTFYHKVHGHWKAEVVIGNDQSLTVAGSTAAQFGKGLSKDVLYVTTNGAQAAPINGTASEGGKLVAVDTRDFIPSNR